MTAPARGAASAALALLVALVVFAVLAPAAPPASPAAHDRSGHPPRADLELAAATADALPLPAPGARSEPAPLDLPPPANDASAAAPSIAPAFTVAASAIHRLGTGAFGAPAADARLELGLTADRRAGEPLMTFDTGPDGVAHVDIPRGLVPATTDGKPPWVWLRAQGPGLLTRIVFARAPEEDGATVSLRVDVQPGALVEGRVVGPDGSPVAGKVEWRHFGEDGVNGGLVGMAGSDGLFRGELRFQGRHGLLAAGTSQASAGSFFYSPEQFDLGTGFSDVFDVDFDEPVPFVEVRVSGPGLIRGRVLDAGGAPAAGLQLTATLAELADDTGGLRGPKAQDLERRGGGHLRLEATTDADGAFAIRGLRNGLFLVHATKGNARSSGQPILLTDLPVPSDGTPLELRLTRRYLAVHVREADGTAPEGDVRVHGIHRRGSRRNEGPEPPGLLIALSPRDAHLGGRYGPYLQARAVAPGEVVVELDDLPSDSELEVDVGMIGGELPWRPQRVVVPPDAGRVDVDVVVPPPASLGSLVLDVVDASGVALVALLRVRIVDPATGVVLVDVPCDSTGADDWPLQIPLPEGAYRLLVEGHPLHEMYHGTLMKRRVHGGHEQELLISAGVESRVTAALGEPARLTVRVIGEMTEADREAVRAWSRRSYGREADEDSVDQRARFVSLRFERDGRWPERPEFAREAMQRTSAAGTHLFSTLTFGSEETSEPLTPGSYALVATTAGGRETRRDVTLVPGQTLAVTLRLP